MGKVICDLCGTSYSDTAELCPICGSARPVEQEIVPEEANDVQKEYHHVSGGRFSKSNVKKRNVEKNNVKVHDVSTTKEKKDKKDKDTSNKPLVLTIIILLIAIFAVLAYDIITLFVPDLFGKDEPVVNAPTYDLSRPTEAEIQCTDIQLDENEISIEVIGDTYTLEPVLIPGDTTDECVFSSDNNAVATVSAEGIITAVGSGEAVITVSCGDISVTCDVYVPEPKSAFALDYEEITLNYEEQEVLIYTGDIASEEILWASDDESIAYIYMGYVIAVGEGETVVYAGYNGEIISCVVRCEFLEPGEIPETEPSDETEETEQYDENGPYKIKNKYGFSDADATITVGESFTLNLVDKNGEAVTDVSWTVVDGNCCTVSDGVVTGVASGQAKVVATYHGKSYNFLVRVG